MNATCTLARRLATVLATSLPIAVCSQVLSENFEDGVLDDRISISTIGSFGLSPGIQSLPNFGSTKAFGFGVSTCGANCFNSFVSRLEIHFASPTPIGSINFREMELYGNWGSNGLIAIDGVSLTGALTDFGRLPYNDFVADSTYRTWSFSVNSTVSSIIVGVYDITSSSQIALDDLVITSVPEVPTAVLLALGMAGIAARKLEVPKRKQDDA